MEVDNVHHKRENVAVIHNLPGYMNATLTQQSTAGAVYPERVAMVIMNKCEELLDTDRSTFIK